MLSILSGVVLASFSKVPERAVLSGPLLSVFYWLFKRKYMDIAYDDIMIT